MGDINGDGFSDVVVSNFMPTVAGVEWGNLPQYYYTTLDDKNSRKGLGEHGREGREGATTIFASSEGGRSVDIGNIYDDSALPDIAYGMGNSTVRLFANLGLDDQGKFLGFEERDTFYIGLDCSIRDIKIVSLFEECYVSILAADGLRP